ncbi:MAG: TIM-barrel domain-containing protein, partial [Novosphingobium sp.]
MTKTPIMRFVILLLAGTSAPALAGEYKAIDHGVIVTPDGGTARQIRVIAYGHNSFRVTATPSDNFNAVPASLMVIAKPEGDVRITATPGMVTLTLPGASAKISLTDGRVSIFDAQGRPQLSEDPRAPFRAVMIDGNPYAAVSQRFNQGSDEGFYGLGQHQNRQMNYNGEDVELAQHNMDIAIPFVISTRNYGLLWDNDGISRFGNPHPYALVGEDALKVSSGGHPRWKADYYLGNRLAVSRNETTINYQFIRDQAKWPEAGKARKAASPDSGQNTAGVALDKQRVIWTGSVTPDKTGLHRFKLYSSSYAKVFVDGRPVLERWRQNWNPWYHNFDLPMHAGKPAQVRIEWEPNAGYIALLHNDPQPEAERHALTMTSDVSKAVDYYYVGGKNMDDVIAGYRYLTGKASMMPQWSYGFWQSRQRYDTQEHLLEVVREYRHRQIPLDTIVQDWFYWPENQWGSHDFDKARYPDPKAMVDEVHALNARIMISVWPKFYPGTDNAKALATKGWLYRGNLDMSNKDWVGPGYANTDYDAYSPGARQLYFDQLKPKLVDLGFDAWWMDATEPDIHSNLSIDERIRTMGPTAIGPAAALFNSFPLVHAQGLAENLRLAQPNQRPFILSRSGFGGLQRASSAVWSGDTAARWDDLRDQISAGVNLSMSGLPYWTHDIGGFALEDRYTNQEPAHLAEWRELNLRWFQFGAFSPLFRSHGETPKREIYEIAGQDQAMN